MDKPQAAALQLIYYFYDDGKSLSQIKEILESLCVPSPLNKPRWGLQTLSNILSNPHYLGSDVYPQIIQKELFDEVQRKKIANNR